MPNGDTSSPFTVIVPLPPDEGASSRWRPVLNGSEVTGLVVPQESREQIIREAANVLGRCVPPSGSDGQETGLVIGHVQSGKTMSFTTVAALARDNGYRIIIVITGTSIYLLNQSRQRLVRDLRLETRTNRNPWRHIPDPTVNKNSHVVIQNVLADWNDPTVPDLEKKTLFITVMKHHSHLNKLINVLSRLDLHNTPGLVIDDEGDQAGLNTRVRQNDQSMTYRRLLALKASLPHHTFLQYTATPQAPLLINIADVLSPEFAEVITPGSGYLGGRDFFGGAQDLIRTIPITDIPSTNNQLAAAPPSLLHALQVFFLGVAAGLSAPDEASNRSMLVHPSQKTDPHRQYHRWIAAMRNNWKDVLELPSTDRDHVALVHQFQAAYVELQATVLNLSPFESLYPRLRHALRRTEIREVNSRSASNSINWSDAYSWILVGGQAMDRGFTVEGLTITYMPRDVGLGMADTIQQRGRFFGYKRRYRGFCRVYLLDTVRDAFVRYIDHEEDVRGELERHRNSNRPLIEWKREFFLDRTLRPTRDSVIDIAYGRIRLGNDWIVPDAPHASIEAIPANREVVDRFRRNVAFGPYEGLDRRTDSKRNLVARNIPLDRVLGDLLAILRFPRLEDSLKFGALLRLAQRQLRNDSATECTVFLMAEGEARRREQERGKIKQLFQGRQSDTQGPTYNGDRAVKDDNVLSIQLHYIDIGSADALVAQNVPFVAAWVPVAMARDVVRQPQGGRA